MEYVFEIPIKAQVKQRPRFGRGVTFTPKETRQFERALSTYFSKIKTPFVSALKVEIQFFFKKPKKTKFSYPPKGDVDNYSKAVLDSMNGKVYRDDSQVVELIASKKWGDEDLIIVKVTQNNEATRAEV